MTAFVQFCIAGTHSGAGKTTLTLGILAALRRRGIAVQPFKCGPDYIDPGYHRQAAGRISRNLDTWMMGEAGVCASYASALGDAKVAVVEGVMGLFDGLDSRSSTGSSAHVAALLQLPVILVVPARGMARSIAAMVAGYVQFDPAVQICAVIANGVSSDRHALLLRDSLAAAQLPPLLGWLPRQRQWELPERHLGLMAETEQRADPAWYAQLAAGIEAHVDLDAILARCGVGPPPPAPPVRPASQYKRRPRLGIARDEAFHFYYQDNLDSLTAAGIELVEFSPLHDQALPADVQGLYIGGGFPEMFGTELSANAGMRDAVKQFAGQGGKIYAECGGLMYLCRRLYDSHGHLHEMCNVLGADTHMQDRLRRLGYVEARTLQAGPFGPPATLVRGHEFHWSQLADTCPDATPAFTARYPRRTGCADPGLCLNHVWASYIHVHFASNAGIAAAWRQWLLQ